MSEKYIIEIVLKGADQVTPAATTAKASLGSMSNVAKGVTAIAMLHLAKRAAQATAETIRLGASSVATRDRLKAFAGGAEAADEMLTALNKSSDNTVDRMTATALASSLLEQRLVTTTSEMEIAGAMVGKLGRQTWSTEQRMNSLTMLLANRSTRRLDDFGLSVEAVTSRAEKLEAQGYSTGQAFKAAVFAEASEKLEMLGDVSDEAYTKINQLTAAWKTLGQTMSESLADIVGGGEAIAWISRQLSILDERTRLVNEGLEKARELGVAPRLYAEAYKEAAQASKNWQQDEDELRKALEAEAQATREATWAAEHLAAADKNAADAAERRRAMAGADWMRRWSAQAEVDNFLAQLEYQANVEDLEKRHQENLRQIVQGGQRSQTEIVREAYQARMDALSEAMQAELDALSDAIAERNFQQQLADMERQHQERIRDIRDRARETERQAEDRRYRELIERLNAEQQARLNALRQQYGRGEDATSERERLEEEHRRRMMGLYTESARAQERKRYEEALKAIEYQEAEAALLEQFEQEKRATEVAHARELERIKAREIEAAIAAENRRFEEERRIAQERRAQQLADDAARREIEERFAAQQADLQRALALEIAEIERAALAERIAAENAAFQERLRGLDAFATEANRRAQEHPIEIPINVVAGGITAGQHWEDYLHQIGVPGYQYGTGYHRGGLAMVGERGPELLDLPAGSRVTPTSRMGGGGIGELHLHFGPGSIRSERDIRQVAEYTERALYRLRGQGVIN